jgi:hypothetical protein
MEECKVNPFKVLQEKESNGCPQIRCIEEDEVVQEKNGCFREKGRYTKTQSSILG